MLLPGGYLLRNPQGPERPASGDGRCVPQALVADETQCQKLQVSGQADVGYTIPCSPHRRGCLPEGILRPHLEQSKRPRGAEPPEPFQRE